MWFNKRSTYFIIHSIQITAKFSIIFVFFLLLRLREKKIKIKCINKKKIKKEKKSTHKFIIAQTNLRPKRSSKNDNKYTGNKKKKKIKRNTCWLCDILVYAIFICRENRERERKRDQSKNHPNYEKFECLCMFSTHNEYGACARARDSPHH